MFGVAKKASDTLTRSYLDTLARRMGEGQPMREGDQPPLTELVSRLASVPQDQWWSYAFSHEPLRGKISKGDRRRLAEGAIECANWFADDYSSRLGTTVPSAMARALSLDIERPDSSRNGSRVLFAEYLPPAKIRVYGDGVRHGERLLSEPGVAQAFGDGFSIFETLLGHELFHVIEERHEDEIWTRTHQIPLWGIGPLTYRSTVDCLSEMGAMAFTRRLNGLSWSPYLLDAFLLYGYAPHVVFRLFESMSRCAEEARAAAV